MADDLDAYGEAFGITLVSRFKEQLEAESGARRNLQRLAVYDDRSTSLTTA